MFNPILPSHVNKVQTVILCSYVKQRSNKNSLQTWRFFSWTADSRQ